MGLSYTPSSFFPLHSWLVLCFDVEGDEQQGSAKISLTDYDVRRSELS